MLRDRPWIRNRGAGRSRVTERQGAAGEAAQLSPRWRRQQAAQSLDWGLAGGLMPVHRIMRLRACNQALRQACVQACMRKCGRNSICRVRCRDSAWYLTRPFQVAQTWALCTWSAAEPEACIFPRRHARKVAAAATQTGGASDAQGADTRQDLARAPGSGRPPARLRARGFV